MYENGHGVSQDYEQEVELFKKSALQGNAEAQSNLGVMYENGHGVSQDYAKALELFRKSADQGNAEGQNGLGVMYANGLGVQEDHKLAVEWFRKSADQGNAEGQKNLRIAEEGLKQQSKTSVEHEQNNQGKPIISRVIVLLVIVGIIYLVIFGSSGKISDTGSMICQNCGTRGEPKTITKGSVWIEIILWLCLIVPGLIYSIWRLTTKQKGCPSCGQVSMIPVNTPIGRTLVEKMHIPVSSSANMA